MESQGSVLPMRWMDPEIEQNMRSFGKKVAGLSPLPSILPCFNILETTSSVTLHRLCGQI